MDEWQDAEDTFFGIQDAIINWGQLLLASGGALKPAKCFFHLISFKWNADGKWSYKNNEENKEFRAVVHHWQAAPLHKLSTCESMNQLKLSD